MRLNRIAVMIGACMTLTAGCASSSGAPDAPQSTTGAAATSTEPTTSTEQTRSTTSTEPTEPTTLTTSTTSTATGVDVPPELAAMLAAECERFAHELATTDATVDPTDKAALLAPVLDDALERLAALGFPGELEALRADVLTPLEAASAELTAAMDDTAADEAFLALVRALDDAGLALLRAGVACLGNPDGIDAATATLQLEGDAWLIDALAGSIWVSEKYLGVLVRIDPDTNQVEARIDVGPNPAKVYESRGSIWVRTQDELVRIDPDRNEVVGRIAKSDIGPAVTRVWFTDDALWACDGDAIVRADPSTGVPIARIELGFGCFEPYADDDVVIAWSNDNAPTESGAQEVALIDPATDTLRGVVALPFDIGLPAVASGRAVFAGDGSPQLAVVDLPTGTVTSTVDLGVPLGSVVVNDERGGWWVTTADLRSVLRIDATTFDVVETVTPVAVIDIAVLDQSLWTVAFNPLNMAQRFDSGAAAL